MKTEARMDPHKMAPELLSVDVDAHLQKLTAHIFPSPVLLPVELVRSALKRRATSISIHVHSRRIEINDNGEGIGSAEWQALACVADTRQTVATREKSITCLQDLAHPGIGLLAVFLPGARNIHIENAGPDGKSTLRIANGRIELQSTCSWPQGTRIMISRHRGPDTKEKMLLAELCAAVQTEIRINGRPLQKKPLLTCTMVSMNITLENSSTRSSVAIPFKGEICRIWLLDQGIPWQVTAMAPVQGMVFAAALETTNRLTPATLETLTTAANGLYQWLAESYLRFPETYQSRIEELFFKQVRSGGDSGLLSICAPFRLWHSLRRLNLAEVRHQAENGILYAMDHGSRPSNLSGPERDVLLLTPRQKDFLINHLNLSLVVLSSQLKTKIRPKKILAFCRRKFASFYRLLRLSKADISDKNNLSREENNLCRELEMHWRYKLTEAIPGASAFHLSVEMIEGRGIVPAYWLKNELGDTLQIRRRHPLTLLALQSINQDRANSELAFAALMPSHFLTAARQRLKIDIIPR